MMHKACFLSGIASEYFHVRIAGEIRTEIRAFYLYLCVDYQVFEKPKVRIRKRKCVTQRMYFLVNSIWVQENQPQNNFYEKQVLF